MVRYLSLLTTIFDRKVLNEVLTGTAGLGWGGGGGGCPAHFKSLVSPRNWKNVHLSLTQVLRTERPVGHVR